MKRLALFLLVACGGDSALCTPLRCMVPTQVWDICTCGENFCDACILDGDEYHVATLRCDTRRVVKLWCGR